MSFCVSSCRCWKTAVLSPWYPFQGYLAKPMQITYQWHHALCPHMSEYIWGIFGVFQVYLKGPKPEELAEVEAATRQS